MTDDAGRAQRKQLELLQGRLKEANEDLAETHSDGYLQALAELTDEARAAETVAAAKEQEHRTMLETIARYRHDVAEAERALLAPKAVWQTSPAVGAVALAAVTASAVAIGVLLSEGRTPWGFAVMVAGAVLPGPVVAWVWKRRFSGAGGKPSSTP